jgi:hypothetical protein
VPPGLPKHSSARFLSTFSNDLWLQTQGARKQAKKSKQKNRTHMVIWLIGLNSHIMKNNFKISKDLEKIILV